MIAEKQPSSTRVIILTLLLAFLTSGCSVIHDRYGESCNSRAYVKSSLVEFLTRRFPNNAPVRLGVIPFSVPANLAGRNLHQPGAGNELAWDVQAALLKATTIPIVEVLNRQDWPGKKEEFYTGNYGALSMAREAGYDMVLIGNLQPLKSLDTISVDTKLIEVESGITLWYGTTTTYSRRRSMDKITSILNITNEQPDMFSFGPIFDQAAKCIADDVTRDDD
jgi:hypothetical protein